jgi:cytochrome c oxidase subunit 2
MFSINKALGMVPNASENGYLVDHMLEFCHWFMALLFVGWSCYFVYTLWRFRKSRNPKADYHGVHSKASAHLEFSVILIEAVLLLGFGLPLWGKRTDPTNFVDNPDALRVHAIGEQFAWTFHYPGKDGIFGKQSAAFVNASNPLGIDPNDAAGKDDLLSKNELHIVNLKPTVIEITSKDVIHSFALKAMRMAQDAIPGTRVPIWFRPVKIGDYEIICAQLCGAGHYAMKAILKVESPADYAAWEKDTLTLQHPELAKAAEAAAAAPAAAPAAPAAQ